jgi:hypothetical protein
MGRKKKAIFFLLRSPVTANIKKCKLDFAIFCIIVWDLARIPLLLHEEEINLKSATTRLI